MCIISVTLSSEFAARHKRSSCHANGDMSNLDCIQSLSYEFAGPLKAQWGGVKPLKRRYDAEALIEIPFFISSVAEEVVKRLSSQPFIASMMYLGRCSWPACSCSSEFDGGNPATH